jgi:hypothetical protein
MDLVIAYALKKDGKIDNINIFARTSNTYYRSIKERSGSSFIRDGIDQGLQNRLGLDNITELQLDKIGELNILVTNNEILAKHNWDQFENRWRALENQSDAILCENVTIKSCDLYSSKHYAIINNKYVIEGSYKYITREYDDAAEENLLGVFIYLNRSFRDLKILASYKKHFNHNFPNCKTEDIPRVGDILDAI